MAIERKYIYIGGAVVIAIVAFFIIRAKMKSTSQSPASQPNQDANYDKTAECPPGCSPDYHHTRCLCIKVTDAANLNASGTLGEQIQGH